MALTDEDKQWIDEKMERLETSLLTALHQWGSVADVYSVASGKVSSGLRSSITPKQ